MPEKHARFSPSGFERLIRCPASFKMSAGVKDASTEYSERGTSAHALGEFFLKRRLGMRVKDIDRNKLKFWTPEMESTMVGYADFVWGVYQQIKADCPDAELLIEQKVDIPGVGEEGDCFGTADVLIYADGILYVIDYKNGATPVEAKENAQLMAYAYGAISDVGILWGCNRIKLIVYQPNIDNINSWDTTRDHVEDWVKNVLVKKAEEALSESPSGEVGPHCKFCKAKTRCGFMAAKAIEAAQKEFCSPDRLIDMDEVKYFLTYGDAIADWLSSLKEWALEKSLQGEKVPGFKVVEGKSNRTWKDAERVTGKVKEMGFDPYKAPALKGLGDMKKEVGAANFKLLETEEYLVKPKGAPTLVFEDDPRAEYSTAETDFADEITKEAKNG